MIIVDGKKIQDYRLKHGLILDELAKAISSSAAMLNQIETGHKQPSVSLLKRIADYFDLTTDELIVNVNTNDTA